VREIVIPVGAVSVSASLYGEGSTVVVLGHGAGGSRRTPFLVRLAQALAASGRAAALYNFPYSERGRRAPDHNDILELATRAVGERVAALLGPARVVHGGKSMGGRIASQVVAQGAPAQGLVFLGYPLHPPGRPEVLRDRHLPRITVPMLFVQGTRDAFARWDLLQDVLVRLGHRAALHRVEDGDHSFEVPRRSGRGSEEVEAEIERAVLDWLTQNNL